MKSKPKYVMTDDQFNKALELQTDMARNMLIGPKKKSFGMPLFVTYELSVDEETDEPGPVSEARLVIHAMAEFGGQEGRDMLYQLGQLKAAEQVMPITCFVVAEAWSAKWKADAPRPYNQVADDPERGEIITIAGMTIDGRVNFSAIELRRDAKGFLVVGETRFMHLGDGDTTGMENNLGRTFYKGFMNVIRESISKSARNN